MKLEVLDSISEVLEVQEDWAGLLRHSECDLAFSSLSWYIGCCLLSEYSPHVFLLRERNAVKAILPLVKNDSKGSLEFVSLLSDFNNVISARYDLHSVEMLIRKVLNYIDGKERIDLADIREESLLCRALERLEEACEINTRKQINYHYLIDIPSLYEDYLLRKSKSFKKDLRRKRSRSAKRGFTIESYLPDKEGVADFLGTFLRLHKQRINDSVFLKGSNEEIVKKVLGELLLDGVFVAFVLRKGEVIYAIQLSVKNADYLGYWNGGFDFDVESVSPGKLLFERQLLFCIENSIKEFDLMRGDESYKQAWATRKGKLISVSID